MNDLISRQAAIEVLRNRWLKTRNYDGIGEDIAEECEIYLKTLPSAQPERIRGRWERWPRQLVPHNTIWWYVCSACGGNAINGGILTDFCPNCGADMREEELDETD